MTRAEVRSHKLLALARDASTAILQGVADLEAGQETTAVHGAIVATNGLLERRGAHAVQVPTS
jgi:hypothetical protein